jgi:single-stranded-DNA-specific exonuclease
VPATPPKKRWTTADADDAAVAALSRSAGVSSLVAGILVARGVVDAEAAHRFLSPDIARDWRPPESLPGIVECAAEVARAVRDGESIAVFGDFDADGVTATAVLTLGLRALGATVTPVLPHRVNDGYGLGEASVARLIEMRPGLVITVDCGIASADEVGQLTDAGVRVVVTDHHEPSGLLPQGVPVADPRLPGAAFDGFAGAGVALKLLQACGEELGSPDSWLDVADLAALGTVADVVPMLDENRALVAYGLERMRLDPRPGIAALVSVAGVKIEAIDAERIAFGLAPRINAAGRMAHPDDALELLMTESEVEARRLAAILDAHNRARQEAEQDLLKTASSLAEAVFKPGDRALVLAGEGWHEGVRGIVAGRLAGTYGVPTLLFCIEDGVARGSGRSAAGVDLHTAVTSCAEHVSQFGGHAAAVGVTLAAEALQRFEECLKAALATVPAELFEPKLPIDGRVALSEVDREMAAELDALAPFGHANPRPVLASLGVFMDGRKRVGVDASHLKFDAYDGLASISAIAFRCPDIETVAVTASAVDVAFHVDVDEWQGRERVQLLVRDITMHEAEAEAEAGGEAPAAALVDELFADAERILARGDYAGIEDAESFHTKLAGVTFEGRQEVVARLAPGTPLRLDRQADNEFDACACALFDPQGDQVGFLNRRLAAVLAPAIDAGADYEVNVSEVTGGVEGASLGVNVVVARRGEEPGPADAEDAVAVREGLAALPADALDAELVRRFIGDRALHAAQVTSLKHLAAGRSCLTVMATGRGKSLVFHLHAARLALAHGRASVFVYPLRALVADQAYHLTASLATLGMRCAQLTGETSPGSRDEVFAALGTGEVEVVLTTPEFLDRHAARFAATGRIGFVVIDEAHHVGLARTGRRPAYGRLGEVLEVLDGPTVFACTATADDEVAAQVREVLGIREVVLDPSVRDNLRVADRRGATDKPAYVCSLAARGRKTVIYVNSREQSVGIARRIRDAAPALRGRTAFYNGGMARAARHAVERAFRDGDVTCVVATSAFGEGVNIPDVRDVVLYHLPFGRVEFNQLCGRGGRDCLEATVHLLFGSKDSKLNQLILESSAPDADDLRALYATLRERSAAAEEGWAEVTNSELAEDVRRRRPKARLSEKGASSGIGVFRELGLVEGEGLGSYRRLRLCSPPEGGTDLSTSVRYSEGLEESAAFGEFSQWVLGAPAEELLRAFDRPILPSG